MAHDVKPPMPQNDTMVSQLSAALLREALLKHALVEITTHLKEMGHRDNVTDDYYCPTCRMLKRIKPLLTETP